MIHLLQLLLDLGPFCINIKTTTSLLCDGYFGLSEYYLIFKLSFSYLALEQDSKPSLIIFFAFWVITL